MVSVLLGGFGFFTLRGRRGAVPKPTSKLELVVFGQKAADADVKADEHKAGADAAAAEVQKLREERAADAAEVPDDDDQLAARDNARRGAKA